MRVLANWILSALALIVVAHLVPGFHVRGLVAALAAAVVIGLVNATLGVALKVITFPLTVLSLGLFWWVINGLMLWVASILVPGFSIDGIGTAIIGSIVLTLVNLFFRWLRDA